MTPAEEKMFHDILLSKFLKISDNCFEKAAKIAELSGGIKFSGWAPKHIYERQEVSKEIAKKIRALKKVK